MSRFKSSCLAVADPLLRERFMLLGQANPNLRHMNHESLDARVRGLVGHCQTLTRETPVLFGLGQAGHPGTAEKNTCHRQAFRFSSIAERSIPQSPKPDTGQRCCSDAGDQNILAIWCRDSDGKTRDDRDCFLSETS
jgi:hypothetical protein